MDYPNGSFKKKKIYFSQVSNNILRDNTISLKAKGLYALIQSYITIEDFILYKTTLKKDCNEGEKAFESAWNELKQAGYLIQTRHSTTSGTFYYQYDLLDIKDINHTPKKYPTVKVPCGKRGVYNNTDINNTNLNNTKPYNEVKIKQHKSNKDDSLTDYQIEKTSELIAMQLRDEKIKRG